MNPELYIAKRIYFNRRKGEKRVSSPVIKIAVSGVAVGLASMILAVSIVIGFKKEIRNKVIGFGSHIQITAMNDGSVTGFTGLCIDSLMVDSLKQNKDIKHLELFTNIPGIIKTDNDFQGVLLKGVDRNYDWTFFKDNLTEGDVLSLNDTVSVNEVLISKYIADKLHLKLHDDFIAYFINDNNARARKFRIKGIYNTYFEEYDKLYLITNMQLVQHLQGWDKDKVSGIELYIKDFDKLDEVNESLFYEYLNHKDKEGNVYYVQSVKDMNPSIFGWLDLLDTNVVVIILLMLAISVFTMTSGLLIIILENTNLIGMLKTMGMKNKSIRKTFLYVSSFLVLKGMIWGNIIAIGIIVLQEYTGFLKLNAETYYVSQVPVNINILYLLLLNIGTLVVTVVTMIVPSYLVSRISPAKSVRFE